jgi:hypothetical protein
VFPAQFDESLCEARIVILKEMLETKSLFKTWIANVDVVAAWHYERLVKDKKLREHT